MLGCIGMVIGLDGLPFVTQNMSGYFVKCNKKKCDLSSLFNLELKN